MYTQSGGAGAAVASASSGAGKLKRLRKAVAELPSVSPFDLTDLQSSAPALPESRLALPYQRSSVNLPKQASAVQSVCFAELSLTVDHTRASVSHCPSTLQSYSPSL